MRVVAKMKCSSVRRHAPYGTQTVGQSEMQLNAVYSADPNDPNKAFADATPQAEVRMTISPDRPASQAFEPGREYFVVFVPVEEATSELVGPYAPNQAGA